MWPGQQPPGGEQNPQDQNPYQQPGYQQPNPYQQPGYHQPGPYPQHAQQLTQQQWPGAPQPSKENGVDGGDGGKKTTMMVAIVAAVAVLATAAVTGVVVMNSEDEKTDAAGGGKPKDSQSAPADPTESADGGAEGGAAGPGGNPDNANQPVIKGWQTVINPKWHVAFDVPKGWEPQSPTTLIGFTDDKDKSDFPKPLVTMSAPAFLEEKWCTTKNKDGNENSSALAAVGSKGAQGAKSQASAAQNEALNWVWAAFDQDKTGKFKGTKAKPFKSAHGVSGQFSSATVTGVEKTNKCSSDGKAYAVTFTNPTGEYSSWVLYGAKGVKGEVDEATVKKIMSTLRPVE